MITSKSVCEKTGSKNKVPNGKSVWHQHIYYYELNQYRYKPGESLDQLGGMIESLGNIGEGEMEEEEVKNIALKAYPGSLNLEEKRDV